jgi:Rad3-related DNA helicase
MTNELETLLSHIGYTARPQQVKLFELLSEPTHEGVIVQAGTGTGKSIAVLAAAARARRETGRQSLVVTPTRVLMDQYMAKDAPAAAEAFEMHITELRGRRWYQCDRSIDLIDGNENPGCLGKDANCSLKEWLDVDPDAPTPEYEWESPIYPAYRCGYQQAKFYASLADIVVTNSDFWIINDRMLPQPVFDLQGAVFVDEAHQLEPKLKDYASRSIQAKEMRTYYEGTGIKVARAMELYKDNPSRLNPPLVDLLRQCWNRGAWKNDDGKVPERAGEVHEGLGRILQFVDGANDNAIVWTDGWSLKLDWIDISHSAGELLTSRRFALVSATIPKSMPDALGVPDALVEDVGHPFDYARQATLRISECNGAFRYASNAENFTERINELMAEIDAADGGCLLLFSSFKDLDRVYDALAPRLWARGVTVLKQKGEFTNAELSEKFKADGRAVLFGSESFATGFDVPGDALKLVSVWKLPYPGKDPVTDALAKRFFPRYRDLMLTRVVQAVGRLIRTETDTGRVYIGDSRFEDILDSKDLMVRHLADFASA